MERYRIKDQKEALSYIRLRLESEHSMELDIDHLLESFIALYLSMLENGATKEELDAIVEMLADEMWEDVETLAVDEHEDRRSEILLFINRELKGKTLRDRIMERCRTFADEIFLIYIIGKIVGYGLDFIRKSIRDNWNKPYENPLIKEAREKQAKGEISVPTSLEEPHYGRGVTISSHDALEGICTNAIVEGWGVYDYNEHKDKAIGFYVARGSSYPCDLCDSYVGYHDIGDESSLPMFHNHCRCYVIWVYNRE